VRMAESERCKIGAEIKNRLNADLWKSPKVITYQQIWTAFWVHLSLSLWNDRLFFFLLNLFFRTQSLQSTDNLWNPTCQGDTQITSLPLPLSLSPYFIFSCLFFLF
jgi:hypothetical protein